MSSIWASERRIRALLAEAVAEGRIVVTKDHDIGVLIRRDLQPHCGVLLLDDLGDAAAETDLILATRRLIEIDWLREPSRERVRPASASRGAKPPAFSRRYRRYKTRFSRHGDDTEKR